MNDKKYKKFLPLGSIVRLKGGQLPVMIIGYTVIPKQQPDKIFDYNATFFPTGTLDTDVLTPFNHKQIEEVIFYGYENEDSIAYRNNLKKLDAFYRMSHLINPEYKEDN